MERNVKIIFRSAALFYLGFNLTVIAQAQPSNANLPKGQDLLLNIEKNTRMAGDITAHVSLTQQKKGQGIKQIEMEFHRRDSDNSFLIAMQAPESEKGNGYLRVGENFWMYRRNTRTFQHVNRDENIGGTDAQGDDFEDRKLTELYAVEKDTAGAEKIRLDSLGKVAIYRLEVKAKARDVDYPKKTYFIRRDNFLILKEQSYAQSGTLMQTAYALKYTSISGRFIAVEQLFIDEFEKGNKTKMNLSNISTQKIAPEIFTKPYLENLSK